jgi:hypothetical protein
LSRKKATLPQPAKKLVIKLVKGNYYQLLNHGFCLYITKLMWVFGVINVMGCAV